LDANQAQEDQEEPSQGTKDKAPPSKKQAAPHAEPTARRGELLQIEGFLPAPMAVPTVQAPKEGYRVAVIAHGAGGRGEHHCQFYDQILPLDVWLVCPTGTLLRRGEPDGGAYYPDHRKLREELRALSAQLKKDHGQVLSDKDWTFIGYSQGATMGALAVVHPREAGEPERIFTRLVLVEGGSEYWTDARSRSFSEAGGTHVTLACGTRGCANNAERSRAPLEKAGLTFAFANAPGAGHTYGGKVADAFIPELEKLF
jgi:pimeloyl-ACP methyl ester carboxylesterase